MFPKKQKHGKFLAGAEERAIFIPQPLRCPPPGGACPAALAGLFSRPAESEGFVLRVSVSQRRQLSFGVQVPVIQQECVCPTVLSSVFHKTRTHTDEAATASGPQTNTRFPWAAKEEKTDQQAALPCGLARDRGCGDVPVISVISANRTRGLSSLHVRVLCPSSSGITRRRELVGHRPGCL